jgi:hypothetical protein
MPRKNRMLRVNTRHVRFKTSPTRKSPPAVIGSADIGCFAPLCRMRAPVERAHAALSIGPARSARAPIFLRDAALAGL